MNTNQVSKNSFRSCLGSLGGTLVFLLLGAGLSYWGWTIVQDAQISTSWPSVEGVITHNEINYSVDADGVGSYKPKVNYEYVVNNVRYTGFRINFGENAFGSRNAAENQLAPYPVGAAVNAYYDPADPVKSMLEPGVGLGSYTVLLVGLCFVSLALIIPLARIPMLLLARRRT